MSIFVSQAVTCALFAGIFGSYFFTPVGPFQHLLDAALRIYLHFLAGVMVHEASHGHLGKTARSNLWWGRFAFLPVTELPYGIFRRTHLCHHRHTNIPGEDPDAFLNTEKAWQFPLRALAMPYQWVYWLHKRGQLTRGDLLEYLGAAVLHFGLYGVVAWFVGFPRVLTGALPALLLQPMLLWYLFAYRTHEGYSTGRAETRSHNYRGRWIFWFSLGLSMHRVHHMRPNLAWLQMSKELSAGPALQHLTLRRDIVLPTAPE